MDNYSSFLASKKLEIVPTGFSVGQGALHPKLFPFQRDIVEWALTLGRAALFEDCGLGKTFQQLEWAKHVHLHTGRDVLILTPFAVPPQTVGQAALFDIDITHCREAADVRPGINITNYERAHLFDPSAFAGVVLDESSILKSFMGSTKRRLLEMFANTPYRLACTATPAPNDYLELGNHAEFLGVMPSNEMISRWFINDTMEAGGYRLKRHAEKDFWQWVASWAVCISRPSDLGYSDEGFDLPPLHIQTHIVEVDHTKGAGDALFRSATLSATTMHKEMRLTAGDRAAEVAGLVEQGGIWAVWCNTNYEADALKALMPDAVELRGSEADTVKERKLMDFASGKTQVLITKPSIAGFGMNWQHCRQMAFVGLSYSYEQFYQALRRSWRYGQNCPVEAHVICAESEEDVLRTIQRKQKEHEKMKTAMRDAMLEISESKTGLTAQKGLTLRQDVETMMQRGKTWEMRLGDCCQEAAKLPDNSVGLSVFSPPFSNLYIYSDSIADMGNAAGDAEFFEHFRFLIRELYRVTKPGRLCAVHCKDLPLYKGRDGAAGLKDFPGEITRAFEEEGWTYHSKVTIWKDPVIEMQRTKNHGLLYKNLRSDSCGSRQGMADYLVVFRKWADGAEFADPVPHDREDFPLSQWQRWASPVWMDIDQTKVLNYQVARASEDEKHICPLQLDVIERALVLWSNPGDLVFSPFAGIGSEGYMAVKAGRRFLGVELKRSYFEWAVKHLEKAEMEGRQMELFDSMPETDAVPGIDFLEDQCGITEEDKSLCCV